MLDDTDPTKLNVHKLICLGLLLCGGTAELKARVLYDALQSEMQKKISSRDKEFGLVIKSMIVLLAYMMLRLYRTETG